MKASLKSDIVTEYKATAKIQLNTGELLEGRPLRRFK